MPNSLNSFTSSHVASSPGHSSFGSDSSQFELVRDFRHRVHRLAQHLLKIIDFVSDRKETPKSDAIHNHFLSLPFWRIVRWKTATTTITTKYCAFFSFIVIVQFYDSNKFGFEQIIFLTKPTFLQTFLTMLSSSCGYSSTSRAITISSFFDLA